MLIHLYRVQLGRKIQDLHIATYVANQCIFLLKKYYFYHKIIFLNIFSLAVLQVLKIILFLFELSMITKW